MRLVLVFLSLLSLPSLAAAGPQEASPAQAGQSPPPAADQPTFGSQVELVTVDVAVVDKKGQSVRGLTRDDFVVTENGVPQALTSFEAVVVPEVARSPAAPRPAVVSTNVVPDNRRGRTFAVVFDDIHLSAAQAQRARAAVAAFLQEGVAEGDLVTLVATAGGAWWTARIPEGRDSLVAILKRLEGRYVPDPSPDRITEYEAMRIEEYQDEQMAWQVKRRFDAYGAVGQEKDARGVRPADAVSSTPGMIPEVVRMRAREVHLMATSRNRISLQVMKRVIESLEGIKGRKSMILVSQGFVYDVQLEQMKDVTLASRRCNVPIYFVDTRGLQALPEEFTASFPLSVEPQDVVAVLADLTREAEGTEALALDTGGFVVKSSNDLAGGMRRVSNESRAYYLLGYNPGDLRRDGKFRKIEVKLRPPRGKGLTVRARRGYYAPLEGQVARGPQRNADPAIGHALDSPFEIPDVPLRVSSFVFDEVALDQLSVQLAVEIDVSGVDYRQEADRSNGALAFLIEAQHRESGEYYRYDQKIELSLLPETRRKLDETGYSVAREFTLPPGAYQAKVVVRDLNSGKVGSVVHDFEVPKVGALRVSTPVLSDSLEQDASGNRRPVLQVRRSFATDAVLYCQFSVYGARKEDASLMPRVRAGYEIRRTDGVVFKRTDPTPINPTSVGALLRLNGIGLRGAQPGEYELVLTVKDDLANQSVEVREPFEIVSPARART
ncbi:MAG TPA: VWA domain-containing protein [Vicinamibacteria bacterium]|nr:VWA domain-containing protein [Vicinamibacteria bacterium]